MRLRERHNGKSNLLVGVGCHVPARAAILAARLHLSIVKIMTDVPMLQIIKILKMDCILLLLK